MRVIRLLLLCLASNFLCSFGAQASEKEELALALSQLKQVKMSLDRARAAAMAHPSERYFFDFLRASQDIDTVSQGIESYLKPSRSQPTVPFSFSGQYRQERNHDK